MQKSNTTECRPNDRVPEALMHVGLSGYRDIKIQRRVRRRLLESRRDLSEVFANP